MVNYSKITEKARTSNFYRWLLNKGLHRMIPFNKPHGFWIEELQERQIRIRLPYRRVNMNHIRGLHACALATLSEYATGFLLISNLDPGKFRLILKRLEIDYHYQAKSDAFAEFGFEDKWFHEMITVPLASSDSVTVSCPVKISDISGNHLTSAVVVWQIKPWSRVKTKL